MWTLFWFSDHKVLRPQGLCPSAESSVKMGERCGQTATQWAARLPHCRRRALPAGGSFCKQGRSAVTAAELRRAAPPSPQHRYDSVAP